LDPSRGIVTPAHPCHAHGHGDLLRRHPDDGQIAALLNRTGDIATYTELATGAAAFNQALYKPEADSYHRQPDKQCDALCLGLVERSEAPAVLDVIVADVRAQGGVTAAMSLSLSASALADGGRST